MHYRTLISATLAGAAALASAVPAFAADTVIKVTSCQQRAHDHVEVFLKGFLEPINAKKAGLTLSYLGGPEVTPFTKQGSAVKRGLIDMIHCPTAYYGGDLPEARLPGVHNKSLAEMRKNGAMAMLEEAWNKGLNSHIVAWAGTKVSSFYVYMTTEPKLSENTGLDLTGKKVRSTGLYNPMFKAMGATVVTMAPGDVFAGLERGVVEGMAWPRGSVATYGWERFLKYRIEPTFYGSTYFVIINKAKYDKLSKAHKDLLAEQGRLYEESSNDLVVPKFAADDKKQEAAGVKVVNLTGKVRQAYLKTIYDAKWAQNDAIKNYHVDYKKLKSLMYSLD